MVVYEVAVLYHPSLEVGLSKAEEQIQKIFTSAKAKVTNTDNWGKRKLVYPIKKQDFAIYVFYTVEIEPAQVQKIEAALNISDEVIRYLIVKPDLKAKQAAEEEKNRKAAHSADDGKTEEENEDE